MKKIIYIIGFLSSAVLTIGATFKLLHITGANILFMTGFLVFLLIFIPLLAFDRYAAASSSASYERLKIIIGLVAAVITGISGLFKLMHLQGANVLLLLGVLIFTAGILPLFFYSMYKKSII